LFGQLLVDEYMLSVRTRDARRNINGRNITELRRLFGGHCKSLDAIVLDLTRKARALGQPAPATFAHSMEATRSDGTTGICRANQIIEALLDDHEFMIRERWAMNTPLPAMKRAIPPPRILFRSCRANILKWPVLSETGWSEPITKTIIVLNTPDCYIELIHRDSEPALWIVRRSTKLLWFKKRVSSHWFNDKRQALAFANEIKFRQQMA